MNSNSSSGVPYSRDVNNKSLFKRTKKICPLAAYEIEEIDYKNPKLLARFISERGRILPRRITSVCAKKQRALNTAIKRARMLGILPYSAV